MSGHWLDRPGTALAALVAFVALLLASVVAQLAFPGEAHAEVERWTGGMALLGALAVVAGCAAAALAGLLLGRAADRRDGHDDDER